MVFAFLLQLSVTVNYFEHPIVDINILKLTVNHVETNNDRETKYCIKIWKEENII